MKISNEDIGALVRRTVEAVRTFVKAPENIDVVDALAREVLQIFHAKPDSKAPSPAQVPTPVLTDIPVDELGSVILAAEGGDSTGSPQGIAEGQRTSSRITVNENNAGMRYSSFEG